VSSECFDFTLLLQKPSDDRHMLSHGVSGPEGIQLKRLAALNRLLYFD